jgi:hypothetical protein
MLAAKNPSKWRERNNALAHMPLIYNGKGGTRTLDPGIMSSMPVKKVA